jgi:hypothetical protein
LEEQREQIAARGDAKCTRDDSHCTALLPVFRRTRPGAAIATAGRDVRSTGPLRDPTLATPEAYAAHDFSVCGFTFVADAFVRGDQSRLGCLSSRIAGRCAPVSC